MKSVSIILAVLVSVMITSSCANEKSASGHAVPASAHADKHKVQNEKIRQPDAGTLEMIDLVKEAVNKIDPENITYYLNQKRADKLLQKLQGKSGLEKLNTQIQYAMELLRTGNTESAIKLFQNVEKEITTQQVANKEKSLLFLRKNLAIAYMRKGEQENCLQNHSAASCIIPIIKEGQHQLSEGSSNAIEMLNKVLTKNPGDEESQYLLNIAHMTLGQYPDKVPDKFLIPPEYFNATQSFPRFKDVAMSLGVDVAQLSGGVCIDDFNNDGYLDIIASSWGFNHQVRYFEQDGHGGFTDKTASSGLYGVTGGLNLRHADFNNDGYLDFLILRGAWFFGEGKIPNSLIKNNGDGTFTDVTKQSGIYSQYPTQTAVWTDFDLDGWLDLFIANESGNGAVVPCEFYKSNGDGTFENITESTGLTFNGFFKGVTSGDLNNDGYPELYISTLGAENRLFINQSKGGPIKFQYVPGVGVDEPQFSFPTWIFDFNNDGFEDIFVSGYSYGKTTAPQLFMESLNGKPHVSRPHLYRNNGNGSFTEVSTQLGLTEASTTMGCNFGDLDNDGFLDFYLATGEPSLYSIVPNRMYKNNRGKRFEDVSYAGGFGHVQKGHAVGFGDLDMDGDQDIYAVMGGAYEGDVFQNVLFENPIGNKNNFIHISLEGSTSNRSAIGARIQLEIIDGDQTRTVYHTVGSGASFGGNSLLAEIGVGQAQRIEQLTVYWPNKSRSKTKYIKVPVNVHIKIYESDQRLEPLNRPHVPFKKTKHTHH